MQGMAQSQYQQHLPHFSGHYSTRVTSLQSNDSRDLQTPFPDMMLRYDDPNFVEPLPSPSFKPQHIHQGVPMPLPHSAVISSGESRSSKGSINFDPEAAGRNGSPLSGASSGEETTQQSQYFPQQPQRSQKSYPQLSNHHHQGPQQYQQETPNGSSNSLPPNGSSNSLTPSGPGTPNTGRSSTPPSDGQQPAGRHLAPNTAIRSVSRPMSAYSMGPDARNKSPQGNSPNTRAVSSGNYDNRRSSYLDLTQPAHVQQQHRPVSNMDNAHLQRQVGAFASLLSSKQTLEMYRANAKKTQDPMLQYELAVFMVQLAQQSPEGAVNPGTPLGSPDKELLREARATLERICSRLPQAQYYLADAYSSGLFNKGTKEDEKAFPLFVAASKHGHAEAGYRAALCYEFGWGCRKDPLKAVQFFRHAASKSHPGAMTRLGIACLRSDLGLQGRYREGLKWLKRATEIADIQYPSAPYELGLLHETGYGDSVLPDPSYSAQLFTQAAELGHADASFRMGDAYEHGKLNCPRDPALSVHFYTGAAQRGHATAMMALCAWYLVGAEPVLEKNEREAYAWAAKAAEQGLSSYPH